MDDSPFHIAWIGVAAFLGVLARAARWVTPEGLFSWQKCLLECLAAPAIGVMTAGGAEYFAPTVNIRIVGGAAALFGLLGPAAIEAVALKWFDKKVGL